MGWNANWPLSTIEISSSPDQKQQNFLAIEQWWDVEHYTFTSGTSGQHQPGRLAALFYGDQDAIDALTSPGCGSLAYATDKGTWELYRSGWQNLTANTFSRVRNVASSMQIPSSSEVTINTWESTAASGMYDTLEEWDSNMFTAKAAGFYVVMVQVSWTYVPGISYRREIGLYKNAGLHAVAKRFGTTTVHNNIYTIVLLDVGDTLTLTAWQNSGSYRTLDKANIHIQRIS